MGAVGHPEVAVVQHRLIPGKLSSGIRLCKAGVFAVHLHDGYGFIAVGVAIVEAIVEGFRGAFDFAQEFVAVAGLPAGAACEHAVANIADELTHLGIAAGSKGDCRAAGAVNTGHIG